MHGEHIEARADFATDYSRQDAAMLNIQRACEAAIDMDQHLIRSQKLELAHPVKTNTKVEQDPRH